MTIIADLSKYQGTVDFAKLSKVVAGVILRVQAGSTGPDPKYAEYVAACKKYKIPFGTYAYFKGISVNDAIQEAKDAFSRMDKASVCFALDIEELTCYNLVAAGQAFIDYLHKQGVKNVGLYSGNSFYNTNKLASIKADWHWIANYGQNDGKQHTAPKMACDLWQYTSVGKLAGITGNVDVSAPVGGKALGYFVSKPTPKPTAPVSKPAAPKQIGVITVVSKELPVHQMTSDSSKVVETLKKGDTAKVYTESNGFYGIGQEKWVRTKSIYVTFKKI